MNEETIKLILDGLKLAAPIVSSVLLILQKHESGEKITDVDLAHLKSVSDNLTTIVLAKLDSVIAPTPTT